MAVTINGSTGVQLDDNDKQQFGTGDDLSIVHDSTNSIITNSTGDVYLRSANTLFQNAAGNENQAIFRGDGACELYYNHVKAFETNAAGAAVFSGGHLAINNATSGGVCALEMGGSTAGDHATYVDMVGDSTYTDYGFRVIRYGGANGQSSLIHKGTGAAGFSSPEGSVWSFSTSSDYRLKENVVSINDGITKLKTLKPYRFNFKHTPDKVVDGFIAHEVSTAVPNAVTGTKDEVMLEDGPLPGDLKKGDPVYQGVDYSKLTPLLTAALQEAIAKIEVLETKVAALEAA